MSRYKKIPVEIEAEKVEDLLKGFKHSFKLLPKWVVENYEKGIINTITDDSFYIKTLEGTMKATKQDYLVKGIDNELYPCKTDIFEKTYTKVEGE